jgi:hypothetical protein
MEPRELRQLPEPLISQFQIPLSKLIHKIALSKKKPHLYSRTWCGCLSRDAIMQGLRYRSIFLHLLVDHLVCFYDTAFGSLGYGDRFLYLIAVQM